MQEIATINQNKMYSSKYLTEQINLFRREEGNETKLLHKSLLSKIELEFEEEIGGQNILLTSYTDESNRQSKQYELNFEQSLQILMSESKSVRRRCVEVMKSQAQEIMELKQNIPSYQIQNPIERAKMWIQEEETRIDLQAKNTALQYRSDFVDVCFETDGLFSMDEVAKILKLPYGRNTMLKNLRDINIFSKSNIPNQKFISNGYFKVVESLIENDTFKKLVCTTYATQKGIGYIHKKMK